MALRSTKEAAEKIKVAEKTMVTWRCRGRGPKYVKIGGKVLYCDEHLDQYITENVIDPTKVQA